MEKATGEDKFSQNSLLTIAIETRYGKGHTGVAIASIEEIETMVGRHPVDHGKTAPATDQGWVDYWTDYYNRSSQLKKASQKNWNEIMEKWKRKLVQAERIRCQKCIEIVKLWIKTYGYGPGKRVLEQSLSERGKTRKTTF